MKYCTQYVILLLLTRSTPLASGTAAYNQLTEEKKIWAQFPGVSTVHASTSQKVTAIILQVQSGQDENGKISPRTGVGRGIEF